MHTIRKNPFSFFEMTFNAVSVISSNDGVDIWYLVLWYSIGINPFENIPE